MQYNFISCTILGKTISYGIHGHLSSKMNDKLIPQQLPAMWMIPTCDVTMCSSRRHKASFAKVQTMMHLRGMFPVFPANPIPSAPAHQSPKNALKLLIPYRLLYPTFIPTTHQSSIWKLIICYSEPIFFQTYLQCKQEGSQVPAFTSILQ